MELNRNLTGMIGLLAAVLVGAGEFLLHFDALSRYGESGYIFMADISEARLTAGHFLAVVGIPFYFIGSWHIFQMLQPAGKRLAFTAFLVTCYGFIFGAVWMGSRATIGSLTHHAAAIEGTPLVSLYELRYETLLQVIRVTTLVLSAIYVYMVLTGRSRYPKWMVVVNPFLLIIASFVVYVIWQDLGKYIMPIALNLAFAIFFSCSLLFGDTSSRVSPIPQANVG